MPSLPFFKKKEESSSSEAPASEPAAEAPATTEVAAEATPAPVPAADGTSAASEGSAAPAVEKTVIEPKRGFFSRKKSTDNGAASESESEGGASHSRIPSFFARKAKPAPTVKEEDKENVPETAPDAAPATTTETEAPAAPVVEEKKDGADGKVRRRISLFARRNRADGAASEPEEGEAVTPTKAKRTSFWKAAAPAEEPAPEDPRLTEAKNKVSEATEAEIAARNALEEAKKALVEASKKARDAKAAVKTVETEIATELKKAKAAALAALKEKKEEAKPAEEPAAAPATTAEPPVAPQVTAAA